jgi:hypothetical protein
LVVQVHQEIVTGPEDPDEPDEEAPEHADRTPQAVAATPPRMIHFLDRLRVFSDLTGFMMPPAPTSLRGDRSLLGSAPNWQRG